MRYGACFWLLLLAACTEADSSDPSAFSPAETATERSTETAVDAATDATSDTTNETATEAESEAESETNPVTETDSESDSSIGPETDTDTATDSTSEQTEEGLDYGAILPDFSEWEIPACDPGQRPVFGEDACVVVGAPCPERDWPENLPGSGWIAYVKPGGTGIGRSPSDPAGSIAEVLEVLDAGATIALAKGTYVESFVVEKAVHIVGACAAETKILAPSPSTGVGTVEFSEDAGGSLRNVTISGDRPGIWVWSNHATTVIEGVVIGRAWSVGLYLTHNSQAEVRDVVVERTQTTSAGDGGWGVDISSGAQVLMENVVVRENLDLGFAVFDEATQLTAEGLILQDTESQASDLTGGRGLQVAMGARVNLKRSLLDSNREFGVFLADAGSYLEASEVVVRRTRSRAARLDWGRGINLQSGAEAVLNQVWIHDNRDQGLSVWPGSRLVADHVTVSGTKPIECWEDNSCHPHLQNINYRGGFGALNIGADVSLSHFELRDNSAAGLVVYEVLGTEWENTPPSVPDFYAEYGTVIDNEIGINIQWHQPEPFDLDQAFWETLCYDNHSIDLDYSEMPLPDPRDYLEQMGIE